MSVRIIQGDVREELPKLPADFFDCIVTSPPYYGLRDYGTATWDGVDPECDHIEKESARNDVTPERLAERAAQYGTGTGDGSKVSGVQFRNICHKCGARRIDSQIGIELTLDAYLETMVAVCRELRRVLKPTGVFFLNIGDSYNGGGLGGGGGGNLTKPNANRNNQGFSRATLKVRGLKPKDLCLVPERLGIALQEQWYAGKIKNIADRIWLAAMIDAEGCIYIHKRKAGTSAYSKFRRADGSDAEYFRTKDSFAIGIEVANTCEAIIRKCVEIVGNGSVSTQGPEDNARRKQLIYRWHLRCDEAKSVLHEVYPHLVSKQQQARIALGAPSSGLEADAAHQALIGLHNGVASKIDFKVPDSLYSPGWYVRSQIKWIKPNPMPESVTDRPTSAHETIWMLTKSARYFWDGEAVKEDASTFERQRSFGKSPKTIALEENGTHGEGGNLGIRYDRQARNLRNVWLVASHPFSQAHFATMPPEIAERCIKAGSSDRGCCPACGAPWVRIVEHSKFEQHSIKTKPGTLEGMGRNDGDRNLGGQQFNKFKRENPNKFLGWKPSCNCPSAEPIPARILDPFAGAGTTGLVADRLGRDCTMIDLNTSYIDMAVNRIRDDAPLFAEVAAE